MYSPKHLLSSFTNRSLFSRFYRLIVFHMDLSTVGLAIGGKDNPMDFYLPSTILPCLDISIALIKWLFLSAGIDLCL